MNYQLTDEGDLNFVETDGVLNIARVVQEDELRQQVNQRLRLQSGSWFAYPDNGIDYYGITNNEYTNRDIVYIFTNELNKIAETIDITFTQEDEGVSVLVSYTGTEDDS